MCGYCGRPLVRMPEGDWACRSLMNEIVVGPWAIPKPLRPDLICQRWEPDEQWYEMGPCGCEVDSFIWRTGVVEAAARDLTGRQLPAPRRELAP